MSRTYNARLGPVKVAEVGCAGLLAFFVVAYAIGWLFWSWLLTVAMGAWGPYHWSYFYTLSHWGLLCPFVLG